MDGRNGIDHHCRGECIASMIAIDDIDEEQMMRVKVRKRVIEAMDEMVRCHVVVVESLSSVVVVLFVVVVAAVVVVVVAVVAVLMHD